MKKILPPDPDGMSGNRAEWAAAALRQFQHTTGGDYEDSLGDLLCDLMHWSDRHNFDFDAALFRARGHYEAETASDLREVLNALIDQIDSLRGESSCIDEDILQGDAYRNACAAVAKAKGGEP